MAVGQNQWHHFGVGAPLILVHFSWDWDVQWGGGILTHGQMSVSQALRARRPQVLVYLFGLIAIEPHLSFDPCYPDVEWEQANGKLGFATCTKTICLKYSHGKQHPLPRPSGFHSLPFLAVYGCGSKPMVPCWGGCTIHFRTYSSGWIAMFRLGVRALAFDPWPYVNYHVTLPPI